MRAAEEAGLGLDESEREQRPTQAHSRARPARAEETEGLCLQRMHDKSPSGCERESPKGSWKSGEAAGDMNKSQIHRGVRPRAKYGVPQSTPGQKEEQRCEIMNRGES